jgi:geranylgeranyl diphosphate synthase, type II
MTEVLIPSYQEQIELKIREKVRQFPQTGRLREACEYALLNGGKRFRPMLVFMIAEALNPNKEVVNAALAIEYFHTASLIADDLPCMDDDDERRNKPTVHKIYGEAIALLASYALIAEGYGAIAACLPEAGRRKDDDLKRVVLALENATFNTGLHGATGGQYLDIFPPDLSMETIREVIHKKTISLFEIAFVFGWLFGGGDVGKLPLVKACASHFGMAFQIADDMGDVEQDLKNGRKINMAGIFGLETAKQHFFKEIAGYRSALIDLQIASPALLNLASSLEENIFGGSTSRAL